jgi:hypothetical protein
MIRPVSRMIATSVLMLSSLTDVVAIFPGTASAMPKRELLITSRNPFVLVGQCVCAKVFFGNERRVQRLRDDNSVENRQKAERLLGVRGGVRDEGL